MNITGIFHETKKFAYLLFLLSSHLKKTQETNYVIKYF